MHIDGQGFEVLSPGQCADRLRGQRLGRLAVVDQALPLIVPIAYTLCGTDVIISAGPGTVARAASAGQIVCFQIDHSDEASLEAWSVAVIGPMSMVRPADLDPAAACAIRSVPWTHGASRFAKLEAVVVTGRCYRPD